MGHLTCRIAEQKACQAIGIDINEEEVAKGREWLKQNKLHEKVTLQYGDMTVLPFENQTFAVVSAMESICCVRDREKAMQEIARVTARDGRLVMTDFVKEKPLTAEQQTALASEGLISTLSSEESIALLKRTGFQVIEFTDLSCNTNLSYQTALTILKEHRSQLIEYFGEQEVINFESEWEALTKIHEAGYFSYRLIVANRIN
jgi:ubiquinone/menaquinone biosynthesis C-methylase UbiE